MVKNMIVFIALIIILLCIISIFNARIIAKKKFSKIEENKATSLIKILSYCICIIMFILIYIYR